MDLFTHTAVGLALGSLSGEPGIINNPLAIGSLIGSVIPDGDIIYQLRGDYTYLKHHRGPSHSVVVGAIISLIISGILWMLFHGFAFWSIFAWTFGGYMLHIGLDIFNAYGANILWPYNKKKIESGLLLIFDPTLLIASGIIFLSQGGHKLRIAISIGSFFFYIIMRWMLKRSVYRSLIRHFDLDEDQRIVVMPSMLRLFKWDFILYKENKIVTGYVKILKGDIEVRDRFHRNFAGLDDLVMATGIGRFFEDFSPHYHIQWLKEGDNHKAVITDLRYYIKGSYLHHGTALFDEHFRPIYAAFHPYSKQRVIEIPV